MIRTFFKTALRNLWNTKGYSFLNIFGLAVGITAAALIFLWVESVVTRNDHFPNKNDIYIVKSKQKYDDVAYVFEATPGLLAPAIKEGIAGIKHTARMDWGSPLLFSVDEKDLYQDGYHADPDILDILSIEFIEGSPTTALSQPNNIVLSQEGANRLFGSSPAYGNTVRINNDETYIVSGIVKDFPDNSSFRFSWLIPYDKYQQGKEWLHSWGNNGLQTLVQLEANADLNKVNSQLMDFVSRETDGQVTFSQNFLYPMTRWNLYNRFDRNGHERDGAIKNVRLFSTIAWIVLLIACINYMNLATARSESRAKEVGVRKVVGSSRRSLILQFIGESIMYTFLSVLLAIGLTYIFIEPFSELINRSLNADLFTYPHIGFLMAIVLICGLLAGSYPAFYLSSFDPLITIKGGKHKAGSTGFVRRGLVILQYTASIILIICTIVIYQQIQHGKNRDIGFDRSQVLTTSLRGDMFKHIDVIKEQLKATGHVMESGISDMSILNIGSNSSGFDWEGKGENTNILIGVLQADENLIPTLSMSFNSGRNFRSHFVGDSTSVLINESFAKLMKKDGEVTGKFLKWDNTSYQIIGVVSNFIYNDVYSSPDPMVFFPFGSFDSNNGVLNIRTKSNTDMSETIREIETVIKANNPVYPFEYSFLDQSFNQMFQSELFVQKMASIFAILSIIISCLGLFALAAFSADQPSKEIGIRKVLGASITSLINLLNKEFLILVGLSCLIAFPIAGWLMHNWLLDYEYHIHISWLIFVLVGVFAVFIALLTISSQAFRISIANPTKTLRDE